MSRNLEARWAARQQEKRDRERSMGIDPEAMDARVAQTGTGSSLLQWILAWPWSMLSGEKVNRPPSKRLTSGR